MLLSIAFSAVGFIFFLGSTQSQQTTPLLSTCNACCQGVAGIPGIPGSAGHNGLPGRDGLRGEKGDSGKSIKGDKGDIGQGLPGPEGPSGQIGLQGVPGEPGEKGESGRIRRSAFTVTKNTSQTGSVNDVVTFNEAPTNINGDFSLSTHKFTCRISGTYVFSYSMGLYPTGDIYITLVKNDQQIVTAHARVTEIASDYDTTSASAVLDLVTGDQVWLKFNHSSATVHSNEYNLSSFTGFLLYEN